MDVSCPRCQTDYEFDDARVPDTGVTVKCTSCNHVFRVRKKTAPPASPQLSPPVRVGDETLPARSAAAPPAVREWKVRQPSGNIFSFKELTTLQKWIVERKVSRDDEISLTGENWKRLGNIAELASFFQIVDDAKKAHELEAQQAQKQTATTRPDGDAVAAAPPAPPPPPPPRATHAAVSGLGPTPHEAPTQPPEPKKKLTETLREPQFQALPPRGLLDDPPVFRAPPLPIHQQRRELPPDVEAETIRPPKQGSSMGMVLGALLALGGLGAAGYYYFTVMQPEQARAAAAKEAEQQAKEAQQRENEARQRAEQAAAEQRAAEAEKKRKEEETALAAARADAGAHDTTAKAPEKPTEKSGEKPGAKPGENVAEKAFEKPAEKTGEKGPEKSGDKPKRSADSYIAQGDRLRDKERAEAALDAYEKALELAPKNVEALTGKGLCYLDMARPKQAEPVLEEAVQLNPRYAPALMGLAESYRFQGKKESAIKMYQKYLDSFPNGPEAAVARANIERLK